jgi:hypothetical protein
MNLPTMNSITRILYGKWTQRTNENYTSGFDVEGPLNALGGGNVVTNGSPLYCTPLQATNAAAAVMATGTVYNALNLGGVAAAQVVTNGGATVNGQAISNGAAITISGTDGAAVTNIAKDVAFGVRPAFTLTSAATVTIPRLTGTNHFILTCTNSTVTLGVATGSWALADFHFYSLSVNRGTNTLAFDTASITNSTVLDVGASTDKTLLFLKPYNSYQHRVRE